MIRGGVAVLIVALTLGGTSVAQERATATVCGTVRAFTAATSTTDGSVMIGSRTLVLRADDLYSRSEGTRQALQVPNGICLRGALDGAGAFVQYVAGPIPSPFCGTVLATVSGPDGRPARIRLDDVGVADMALAPDVDLRGVAPGSHACFLLGIDAAGDAFVRARSTTVAERAVAQVQLLCGLMTQWTPAAAIEGRALLVHRTAGSITIAGRTMAIAAGTEYSLVNSAPVVGQPTCLSGLLDGSGALIQYAAQPGMPGCIGGRVERIEPATATTEGSLKFAMTASAIPFTAESGRFEIATGTVLPPDVTAGEYCFVVALDASGRAVVRGAERMAAGGILPAMPRLPSTSTSPPAGGGRGDGGGDPAGGPPGR